MVTSPTLTHGKDSLNINIGKVYNEILMSTHREIFNFGFKTILNLILRMKYMVKLLSIIQWLFNEYTLPEWHLNKGFLMSFVHASIERRHCYRVLWLLMSSTLLLFAAKWTCHSSITYQLSLVKIKKHKIFIDMASKWKS